MPLDGDPFKGMVPKAGKRKVDKTQSKKILTANRTCVICGDPAASAHHVVPRGAPHFGDDVSANLVGLCGSGTTGCHGDVEARRGTARKELGAYITRNRPDVLAYVRARISPGGDAWLEKQYSIKGGSRARSKKPAAK